MPYVMGLGISTTRAKAIIIDGIEAVFSIRSSTQTISQPCSFCSEQNPQDWSHEMMCAIRPQFTAVVYSYCRNNQR